MLIAVLADSHSNYANIDQALERLRGSGIDQLFHCGDITDSQAAEMFCEFPTSFVFGNGDYDEEELRAAIERTGSRCYGLFGEVECAGRRIAFLHGHQHRALRDAEGCGRYDLVFYGHSHVAKEHRTGQTLVINPGALHRTRTKSIALIDLETMQRELVLLPGR